MLFEDYPADYRGYWRRLAPLGAGRLATAAVARPPRAPRGWRTGAEPAVADLALEDRRQPAPHPASPDAARLPAPRLGRVPRPRPLVWTAIARLRAGCRRCSPRRWEVCSRPHRVAALPPAVRGVDAPAATRLGALDPARRRSCRTARPCSPTPSCARSSALRRGRRLLEWTSAARMAAHCSAASPGGCSGARWSSAPLVALGTGALLATCRPEALPGCACRSLALWLVAPEIAAAVGRPWPDRRAGPGGQARPVASVCWRAGPGSSSTRSSGRTTSGSRRITFRKSRGERSRGEPRRPTSACCSSPRCRAHDLGHARPAVRSSCVCGTRSTRSSGWSATAATSTTGTTRAISRRCRPATSPRWTAATWPPCLLTVKQGCLELVHGARHRARPLGRPARHARRPARGHRAPRSAAGRRRRGSPPSRTCVARTMRRRRSVKAQRRAWGPGVARLLEHGAHRARPDSSVGDRTRAARTSTRTCSPSSASGLPRCASTSRPCGATSSSAFPGEAPARARSLVRERRRAAGGVGAFERCLPLDPTLQELPSACESASAGLDATREATRCLARRRRRHGRRPSLGARLREADRPGRGRRADHPHRRLDRACRARRSALRRDGLRLPLRRKATPVLHRPRRHRGPPDAHHYDLLASEARLASFVAIAKGDVPEEHWLHLGRPLCSRGRRHRAPVLERHDVRVPDADAAAARGARQPDGPGVRGRRTRRRSRTPAGVACPWGMSESGYYRFDAHRNYQYRAFGVPDLGFKRGLEDDVVVAPYASLLALPFAPAAVMANLDRLDASRTRWDATGSTRPSTSRRHVSTPGTQLRDRPLVHGAPPGR